MTTGSNFWDVSIWSFVISLTILLIAMLIANMLRHAIPALSKLMIPSSVLGGFLILFVSFLWKELTGKAMFDRSMLEALTYHGLGLGFAAMSLRNLDQQNKEYKGDSFSTAISVVSSYLIQGTAGLLITIALSFLMNSFFASGLILPMGYGQGPGQAYNWGRTYENNFSFTDGSSFGLTVAAMGFIASSIGGIIYLNRLRRKGIVKAVSEYEDETVETEQLFSKDEIPMADSIDKFTVQLSLVFGSYMLAYLFMRGVNTLIENGALGQFGKNTVQPLIWGFNFLFATLFGLLTKMLFRTLQRRGVIKRSYTNTFMQNRIAGFMFDIMVVASIAAINLSAFKHAEFVVPLLLICVIGAVLTYLYLGVFCRKIFPAYRHEAFLSLYGMLTGTASTGVILLREIDPKFKTPAANNLVYQQSWAILFGAPMLLLMGVAPQSMTKSFITIGIMIVMFFLLNWIVLRKSKRTEKKK